MDGVKNDQKETVSSIIWGAIGEKIFTTQNVNIWCQNPPNTGAGKYFKIFFFNFSILIEFGTF